MRVWAVKIHKGEMFGRFVVCREFKLYFDWFPRNSLKYRWKVSTVMKGVCECGFGSTLSSSIISLYTVLSENYASVMEYQDFLRASTIVRHRV